MSSYLNNRDPKFISSMAYFKSFDTFKGRTFEWTWRHFCRLLRTATNIYGFLRTSEDICELMGIYTGFYGLLGTCHRGLQKSVDVHRSPRKSEVHRSPQKLQYVPKALMAKWKEDNFLDVKWFRGAHVLNLDKIHQVKEWMEQMRPALIESLSLCCHVRRSIRREDRLWYDCNSSQWRSKRVFKATTQIQETWVKI